MITSVQFENFKSLRDVTIDLAPFTVLVGGNGSGKSSVLLGTDLLSSFFQDWPWGGHMLGRPKQVFSDLWTSERLTSVNAPGNFIRLVRDDGAAFSCRWARPPEPFVGQADFPVVYTLAREQAGEKTEIRFPADYQQEGAFFKLPPVLKPSTFLQLDPIVAAEPRYSDSTNPHLNSGGLAPTLQKLQGLRDGRFDAIEGALARVVPSIQRLRAVPASVRRRERQTVAVDGQEVSNSVERVRTGAKVQAEVRGVGWIDADLLSEGTLLTLALLTALHDESPDLLLLDDIDRALHPKAQANLVGELRDIQIRHPNVQIVATSHSPYIVDHFEIEEVRVMRLLESGGSICRPLSGHPKWEKRKGLLKPGEFWAGVGEDWLGA